MRRTALAAGFAALAMTGTAAADHNRQNTQYGTGYGQAYAPTGGCKRVNDQQKVVGGLIGGTLGALAGAAIGNNLGDGRGHNRGYGRGHGYGYGYGGHGGYGGYDRHRRRSGNDDTEQIVGALILGGLGAYAGSQIASSQTDCRPQVYQGIPAPTRQAYGRGWEQSQSPYQQTGQGSDNLYGGQYGRRTLPVPSGSESNRREPEIRECEPVYRETRLPDGRLIREEVQACRDGVTYYEPRTAYGEWDVDE